MKNKKKQKKRLLNEVIATAPTIGSNVEEIVYKNLHFLMWDIGGQEASRASWSSYYSNTQVVILVIDSTNRERIQIIHSELQKILQNEVFYFFLSFFL